MVLAELGSRITGALGRLMNRTVVDKAAVDELIREVCSALLESDVNVRLVGQLRTNINNAINLEEIAGGVNKRKLIHQIVFNELCKLLDPGKEPYQMRKGRSNVIMFVGLQGSGKTTTCAKYARYYKKRGWKVALVCADTFRAGAFDQLKQNAGRAGVDFYGSYAERDPVIIARDGVEKFRAERYEIIIVDTSGRHKQEESLFEEMEQVSAAVRPDEHVFVMDSSIGQAAFDQAAAFKSRVNVGSVVITKLDGHAKGGGALSAVAATQSPVVFIGTGEHLEDLEPFNTKSFVSRLLGMGDVEGLVNTLQEETDLESQAEFMQRVTQGVFTLRDMQEQLRNILKMGSISKMMSMMPGLPPDLLPKGQEKEGLKRLKRFTSIMDSMTIKELDCEDITKVMNDSRISRIARGSGSSIREVNDLLAQFKVFQKSISKMKNMKMPGGSGAKGAAMNRASLQQMSSMLPPGMMQQMGGASGLQSMMKNMMSSLGGGGLGALGKMFGGGGR
nr:signal recognition particle 54 kDa protein [Seculamonas ecuadoriensis]